MQHTHRINVETRGDEWSVRMQPRLHTVCPSSPDAVTSNIGKDAISNEHDMMAWKVT